MENLVHPKNSKQAKEWGSRGGKKSGEVRRLKKTLKERLQFLLDCKRDGFEVADAVSMALIEKALAGDVRAFEVIRDTIGEKPVEKAQVEQDTTLVVRWEEWKQ